MPLHLITPKVFLCRLLPLALAFSPVAAQAQMSFSSTPQSGLSIAVPGAASLRDNRASEWKTGHNSRVRIISGETDFSSKKPSYAGVQLQLSNGWKTYWRSPGDTGVPPSFDWSGSSNLKNIRILWPAPQKYKDEFSTTIGYAHEVILPLKITAKDTSKPVALKLRIGYGICDDICVPIEKSLKLTISPRQSGYKTLLSRYRKMVPATVKSTGRTLNGFSIQKISINLKGKKPNIIIDARVPTDTKKAELYVEASNGFYLPLPVEKKSTPGNHRRFFIDLTKGDPPKDLAGHTLAFTLVGNKTGIEYRHKIN